MTTQTKQTGGAESPLPFASFQREGFDSSRLASATHLHGEAHLPSLQFVSSPHGSTIADALTGKYLADDGSGGYTNPFIVTADDGSDTPQDSCSPIVNIHLDECLFARRQEAVAGGVEIADIDNFQIVVSRGRRRLNISSGRIGIVADRSLFVISVTGSSGSAAIGLFIKLSADGRPGHGSCHHSHELSPIGTTGAAGQSANGRAEHTAQTGSRGSGGKLVVTGATRGEPHNRQQKCKW